MFTVFLLSNKPASRQDLGQPIDFLGVQVCTMCCWDLEVCTLATLLRRWRVFFKAWFQSKSHTQLSGSQWRTEADWPLKNGDYLRKMTVMHNPTAVLFYFSSVNEMWWGGFVKSPICIQCPFHPNIQTWASTPSFVHSCNTSRSNTALTADHTICDDWEQKQWIRPLTQQGFGWQRDDSMQVS